LKSVDRRLKLFVGENFLQTPKISSLGKLIITTRVGFNLNPLWSAVMLSWILGHTF